MKVDYSSTICYKHGPPDTYKDTRTVVRALTCLQTVLTSDYLRGGALSRSTLVTLTPTHIVSQSPRPMTEDIEHDIVTGSEKNMGMLYHTALSYLQLSALSGDKYWENNLKKLCLDLSTFNTQAVIRHREVSDKQVRFNLAMMVAARLVFLPLERFEKCISTYPVDDVIFVTTLCYEGARLKEALDLLRESK